MKNRIISFLIIIFLLEKSSKGMEKKTKRSSWFRTLVYLFLTLIIGFFFYRSSQVATIINDVEIRCLRGVEDSLHHSLDTIEFVLIANDFKTLGSYRNPYIDYLKITTSYYEGGGVQVSLQKKSLAGVVKNRDSLTAENIKEIETLTGKPIKPYTGSIYFVNFFANGIPSLIPCYPKMIYDKPVVKKDTIFSLIEHVGNLRNIDRFEGKILQLKSNPAVGVFSNALFYQQTIINHYNSLVLKNMSLPHPRANTLNVFSACDLSQYTYNLVLKSDMYIKHLSIAYNVPVEIGNQFEGLYVGPNDFGINDADLINRNLGTQLCFFVKLPTMANLQQIRSIILTALFSALLTLFWTNLFFGVRKVVKYKMLKRRINISAWVKQNGSILKDFKFLLSTIILVILFFVLMFVCYGLLGYTFLIDYGKYVWRPILSVILLISIVSGVIYMVYKKDDVYMLYKIAITLTSKIKGAKKKNKSKK